MSIKRASTEQPVITVHKKSVWNRIIHSWQLYVMLLPTILYFLIFTYAPIAGIQIAFRDYTVRGGIWNSEWVGLKHFINFVSSIQFERLITNTVALSMMSLLLAFPFPIILALLFNEAKFPKFKKTVQTLTYAPHFISTVVFVSMLTMFLSTSNGFINQAIEALGGEKIDFMGRPDMFRWVYVISGIWQGCGWSAIIYVAALAGVDTELYEAAKIDGANRFQKILHIDIPSIMPTVVTLFILNCGSILSVGYEKVYLMQNTMNQSTSEIISTYVYKVGLVNAQYSYTAAIGLFNSIVNLIILIIVNQISKKVSEISLF